MSFQRPRSALRQIVEYRGVQRCNLFTVAESGEADRTS
jgi:hypothetical protein